MTSSAHCHRGDSASPTNYCAMGLHFCRSDCMASSHSESSGSTFGAHWWPSSTVLQESLRMEDSDCGSGARIAF